MKTKWVGLDIGGANTKIVGDDEVKKVAFPLWKHPERLAPLLHEELNRLTVFHRLAVTMTGELADCFTDKREGVQFICDAVEQGHASVSPVYYQTNGRFVRHDEARLNYLETAASNWHAIASCIGIWQPNCLVIDIGSTTTDIIPVVNGVVTTSGKTDLGRLQNSELFYSGIGRTSVAATVDHVIYEGIHVPVSSEYFATLRDVYLILKKIGEDHSDKSTADGRPATIECAHRRLAKTICADVSEIGIEYLKMIANYIYEQHKASIARIIARKLPGFGTVVVVGEGDWLAREILAESALETTVLGIEDLGDSKLGATNLSVAGPAWAVKHLAENGTGISIKEFEA